MKLNRIAVIGAIALSLAAAPAARAQYTANFQTNTISGVTSNWAGDYYVGNTNFNDVLLIQSTGVLSNDSGFLGYDVGSSNNTVLVSGAGSAWTNDSNLTIGGSADGNQLIITNGGIVYCQSSVIGNFSGGSNNAAVVTGVGSQWQTTGQLLIGNFGTGNRLTIANGGVVGSDSGVSGADAGSSNNLVVVAGTGSVWSNAGNLWVGYGGFGNQLTITNGGTVFATNLTVGVSSAASHNIVQLDSGSLIVTNAAGNGSLVVGLAGGKAELILNTGTVTVDALTANNGTNSVLIFNGGALITKSTTVSNGATFAVGNGTNSATLTLANGGTGIHRFNDGLVISSNATLNGVGTVIGNATVLGTLSPGFSVGTITNSNNLVLSNSSVLQYELGTNSDLTVVSSNLTLAGTLNIADAGGFTNGTYTLFSYGGTLTTNGSPTVLTIGTKPNTNWIYTVDISTTGSVKLTAEPPAPVASFSGTPTNGTAPLAVTFTDSSTGTISNRFWNFGDGSTTNFAVSTNPVHTYNAGTYAVTLIVSGSVSSSTNIQSGYIVATNLAPPVASFSGTPTNGTAPLAVTFTDSSTGAITNRFWSFGDGATTNTTLNSLGHLYNTAGTNTVSLTVFGPGGSNTNNRIHYIIVTSTNAAPPVASFSGSPTNGTAPLAVTFTDSSTGTITNRFWSFGDGNTTNFAVFTNPVHTYNAGTYAVTLTVSGPGGSNTNTRTSYIVATNPPPPVASFSGSPTNGTAPLAVAFTDNSTGAITNRFWSFGDGATTNTTLNSLGHLYNTAGTNTVSLTVFGPGGSSTTNRIHYIIVASTNAAPDTTPPLLTVLSPVNYQTFTNAAITVAGTASDASGIRSVTVNGAAASGTTNWSTAFTLVSGTNTITVIATDNSANMNTTSQLVHAILNPVIPTNHPPQITVGLLVTNAVLQIETIAVVVADDTNTFTVSATDADGDLLNYQWVFGDSASTNTMIGTVEHVYTNDCGAFNASVTVSDGHASTNSDLTVVVACQMQITKLQANLNFAKTNADSCTVKGTFNPPDNFSFTNKMVTLNIGGAQMSFTPVSKGIWRNGLSKFNKPTYNKRTGVWTFNATLKNGSWRSAWAEHGMIPNIPRPAITITNFPVVVLIDTEAFMGTTNLHYTATSKSGTAK
jgi:T5SS/PEP-CTERM-associated repeat protein